MESSVGSVSDDKPGFEQDSVLINDTEDSTVDTASHMEIVEDPPILIEGQCRSDWTGWVDTTPTRPELHILSMYEVQNQGNAIVEFNRQYPSVLVLSSYEAVEWKVKLADDADVTEIILTSMDSSSVVFLQGSALVTDIGWSGACAHEIPDHDDSGCETKEFVDIMEQMTGVSMSSFQGCYYGGAFSIKE